MTEWTPNIFPTLTIDRSVVSEWEKLKDKISKAFKMKKQLPPPTLPYTGGVRGGS